MTVLDAAAIVFLSYSTVVMMLYVRAVNHPVMKLNVNRSIRGCVPTLIAFFHVPLYWWFPIYLVMRFGFVVGALTWVVSLFVASVVIRMLGVFTWLVVHFFVATIAATAGLVLSIVSVRSLP